MIEKSTREAIIAARSSLPLRPVLEIANEIIAEIKRLETKPETNAAERFAIMAGKSAVAELLRAAGSETLGLNLLERWARESFQQPAGLRRIAVSQLGAAMLAADFRGAT